MKHNSEVRELYDSWLQAQQTLAANGESIKLLAETNAKLQAQLGDPYVA
jgi:hypothetical protein